MSKKPTPEEARKKVLELAYRREKPLLVGEASISISPLWSLSETLDLLWEMVDRGELRPATIYEYSKWDIRKESDAFLDAGVKEPHGSQPGRDSAPSSKWYCRPPPATGSSPEVKVPTLPVPELDGVHAVESRIADGFRPERPTRPTHGFLRPSKRQLRSTMPRFLIDCDEVLADFVTPACQVVSEVLGRPWGLDDAPSDDWDMFRDLDRAVMREADAIMNAKGWCAALEVHPGAQDFVKTLQKLCDVYVCTSPMHSDFWVKERDLWLAEHFGIDRSHIIHTAAKYVCGADFFLDDKPSHVQKWKKEHSEGHGMLWSTAHNKRLEGFEDIRVHSWEEVLTTVRSQRGSSLFAPST